MSERTFPNSGASTTWNRLAERLAAATDLPNLPEWAWSCIQEASERCAEHPDEYAPGDDNEGEISNG